MSAVKLAIKKGLAFSLYRLSRLAVDSIQLSAKHNEHHRIHWHSLRSLITRDQYNCLKLESVYFVFYFLKRINNGGTAQWALYQDRYTKGFLRVVLSCVKVAFCLKYERFWRITSLLFEDSYIMQRVPTCASCKLDLVFILAIARVSHLSAKLDMDVIWLFVIIISIW